MTTSQDLVPNDLPQGGRQEVVAGMQQAGIPLATRPPEQLPLTPAASPSASPAVSGPRVSGFDALQGRSPDIPFGVAPPGTPAPDPLLALRQSPNAMIREIAELMPDYLQGQ